MILYILDDDKVELAMWANTINSSGLDVEFQLFSECGSFKAAVFKKEPDVCVIDFVMPFHPGTEVCNWVKETYPNVKLYICSWLTGEEYDILAASCGAEFISKEVPFNDRLEVVYNGCKS